MALIVPLKTNYSSNNPIEITYLNTGATNDPYIQINVYDAESNLILLYSGVYYHNKDKVIYTDLSPIINGLVNHNDFNIVTSQEYTYLKSAFRRLKIQVNKSIGGVYYEDIGSGFIVVFNESFDESDFIKIINSEPIRYLENNIDYKTKNNFIYSGQGCVGYGLVPVEENFGDEIPATTTTNFSYTQTNDYFTWTKSIGSGTAATFVSKFTNDRILTNYNIGDDLYLHWRMQYTNVSPNVLGQIVTISLAEYIGGVLQSESTKDVVCGNSYWKEYTIKKTLSSKFDEIRVTVTAPSTLAITSTFNTTHWYLGSSSYNTYEPTMEQIVVEGQNTNGSGRYHNTTYDSRDFILNNYNQFYSTPNNVNLPYNTYISRKKKIDILRYSPLNIQLFNTELSIPKMSAEVQYYFDNNGSISSDYNESKVLYDFTYLPEHAYGVHNLAIGYNALKDDFAPSTINNANTIRLSVNLYRLNDLQTSIPTYGRTFLFNIKDKGCYNGNVYQLYWLNRHGGIDHIIMGGNNIKNLATKYEQYKTNWRRATTTTIIGDMSTSVNHRYNVNSEISYMLNTQILSEFEYNLLDDLITSPKMWLFDAQTNETFAVETTDTNFVSKQFRFDKLFNFSIKVARQITNNRTQY